MSIQSRILVLLVIQWFLPRLHGFHHLQVLFSKKPQQLLHSTSSPIQNAGTTEVDEDDDAAIQWDLFQRHHALGSWKGIWTTYDYIGDVIDETVASVNLHPLKQEGDDGTVNMIEHSHTIVVGARRSDCKTCFDSMEQTTLPVAQYKPDTILQRSRLAGMSMVNGPSLLKSGVMSTELILKHSDGRIRVIFQHAPVWAKGIEAGSCPPQGIKLFRTMLSREALRDTAPTAEMEAEENNTNNNNNSSPIISVPPPNERTNNNPIVFYRPVPPFSWHKKWGGTSWTWGPQTGNRGWALEEMEETDAWHGITPVDCWNLRLGSIHLQAPRIITADAVGICRLAWLPDDETLLRVEAGVSVLQPMLILDDNNDDDDMVGFEPPRLTSLRCDMLQKKGELDTTSPEQRPFRGGSSIEQQQEEGKEATLQKSSIVSSGTTISPSPASKENLRDSLSL
jgi:hypothetical protein